MYLYDARHNTTCDGGSNMYVYDVENRLITATKTPGVLSAACDTSLTLTTGGSGTWSAETGVYCPDSDNDAVQSPDIADSQSTWIETSVQGAGTLKFWWKVSSQTGDNMTFILDGQSQGGQSGGGGWGQQSYPVYGSGTHTFRWQYSKDAGGSGGQDCMWLDHIEWTGQMPDPNGWQTITYVYDPSGRRIEKKYDGQTVMKYLYDGGQIIAEYDGDNSLLHKYIYGPGVDQPICMIDVNNANATYYYHFDGLGSVIALTNSAGSVVNLYEYSVYGEVSASDPNHPNRFLFTGREFDKDTGLYYYRARYYNPYIGRFLQTDPIGYGDGTNPYQYCRNNAVNWVDPSGAVTLWRMVGGEMQPVEYLTPRIYTPKSEVAAPDGVWTRKQFFWWYVNKGGDDVDFPSTGLVPKLMSDTLVADAVKQFIDDAKDAALERWTELAPPNDVVSFDKHRTFQYDFGWKRLKTKPKYWQDLIVLGSGKLGMEARIDVQKWLNGGGSITISLTFWIEDWFRDVYDFRNRKDDIIYGFLEFDDGHPYRITGAWWGPLLRASKKDANASWSWDEIPQLLPAGLCASAESDCDVEDESQYESRPAVLYRAMWRGGDTCVRSQISECLAVRAARDFSYS